jgi:hypothetical protein
VRTYLLHRLGSAGVNPGVNPETLIQQLQVEQGDLVARRTLLLSLGGFTDDKLSAKKRRELATKLLDTYRENPDPGIHSAIDWLLRLPQWNYGEKLRAIDQQLAGQQEDQRQWFVNGQGQTLVVLRAQAEF